MPVGKTRTFRVKLAFDQCAGTTAVPSKHNKTTNLFSTDIDIGTFTGPVNNQQCLTTKTVKVSRAWIDGCGDRALTGWPGVGRRLPM